MLVIVVQQINYYNISNCYFTLTSFRLLYVPSISMHAAPIKMSPSTYRKEQTNTSDQYFKQKDPKASHPEAQNPGKHENKGDSKTNAEVKLNTRAPDTYTTDLQQERHARRHVHRNNDMTP